MKKIAFIIGSMIAGGIIPAAGSTWFVKVELSIEKTLIAECKVLFWYDPMYPNTRFDKPGGSSFMGMDLVPKYADEESSASGARIDPTQTQSLGVKAAIVARGSLTFTQSSPADVSYNKHQYAIVQVRVAGFIDKVYPLAAGDKVQEGVPLLDLTIPGWVETQSKHLLLRETGDTTTQTEGILKRLRLVGTPEIDIRRLIATQKIQTHSTLKTPIGGVVIASDLRTGMNITKDNVIAKIQDMNPVWVIAAVPEPITWLVKDASQFTPTISARPDKILTIRRWMLLPGMDAVTCTLQLRPEIDNADGALKPGMNAWLQLNTAGEPILLTPSQTLIDTGNEQWTTTIDVDERFVPKRVAVFRASQGVIVLRSDLAEGEEVAPSGLFPIGSEVNISGALERMRSESATHVHRGNSQ